ncbi:MAG: hypothetical protein CVV64_04190 [Candidatus Wallbacteria bacterium HGW-Wallbacteria-1]|jgi:hypothetical protein|uniref:Adenosine monophosphate-protein transferase n=1 Tax=Candidatus Wallbacteria bacterium HGW-Wallbacteria-1 TaxID=2013854 RepID=A0A2N1PRL7_9BACT|nr:MAG: hypothetical protein CVV64_04190 [Candidatus Wallbacteria bacterium HGW-Wallbacteria-1]
MELKSIAVKNPDSLNIILGQSHFIKTVEDIYEAIITAVPGIRFGIAFCEASGKTLVRCDGNDDVLINLAAENAKTIGAGHCFIIFLGQNFFPINVLNQIKSVPEVCRIFCATANPVQVIVAETSQGKGILGVVDGSSPSEIEGPDDARERVELLRNFGYKR